MEICLLMKLGGIDLSLKLPGFTLHLMRFWDGQPLRYTLKQKKTEGQEERELMVVVFTLVPGEEVDREEEDAKGGVEDKDAVDQSYEPQDDDLD